MPYQNVRGGASHRCGCGTVGLSHSVRTSEGSYCRKGSLALLPYCFTAFQTLLAVAVRRASIGSILHLAVDCRVYPNSSMVVTASGFRSKACRFS